MNRRNINAIEMPIFPLSRADFLKLILKSMISKCSVIGASMNVFAEDSGPEYGGGYGATKRIRLMLQVHFSFGLPNS